MLLDITALKHKLLAEMLEDHDVFSLQRSMEAHISAIIRDDPLITRESFDLPAELGDKEFVSTLYSLILYELENSLRSFAIQSCTGDDPASDIEIVHEMSSLLMADKSLTAEGLGYPDINKVSAANRYADTLFHHIKKLHGEGILDTEIALAQMSMQTLQRALSKNIVDVGKPGYAYIHNGGQQDEIPADDYLTHLSLYYVRLPPDAHDAPPISDASNFMVPYSFIQLFNEAGDIWNSQDIQELRTSLMDHALDIEKRSNNAYASLNDAHLLGCVKTEDEMQQSAKDRVDAFLHLVSVETPELSDIAQMLQEADQAFFDAGHGHYLNGSDIPR